MPLKIDRQGIAQGFSNAADSYTDAAQLQREMARQLVNKIPGQRITGDILDVGCGTGFVVEEFLRFPKVSSINGIDLAPGMIQHCKEQFAEEKRVTFETADFDVYTPAITPTVIASNCALQWSENPEASIIHLSRVVNSNGIVAFCVPVEGSLPELRTSYERILGESMPGLNYRSAAEYLAMAAKAGLTTISAEEQSFSTAYLSAASAIRSLKAIGATFRYQQGYQPLAPTAMKEVFRLYDELYADANGMVPLTYNSLIFIGEK